MRRLAGSTRRLGYAQVDDVLDIWRGGGIRERPLTREFVVRCDGGVIRFEPEKPKKDLVVQVLPVPAG